MSALIDGAALVAGVVGRPIAHSLSPVLHNAWIRAAGLNAVYIPLAPTEERFDRLVQGFRGGTIRGLNVTAPYKEKALALADEADEVARRAGSANLLLFDPEGRITATSTDGLGLIGAFADQAPDFRFDRPAVVLGAGGAARAAAAALLAAGCPEIRIVNRTAARAEELVFAFRDRLQAFPLSRAEEAMSGAGAVINAAAGGPSPPLDVLPAEAVVMDMNYRPLHSALMQAALARDLTVVDGLSMLIKQAEPSFEAFYGVAPPTEVDVRAIALQVLERALERPA
jgi:shikimate dehydrogenase